ncbi:MAG: ATP-dependent DNA ligase [Anaerolineae bacterium]|nr:ATP-dependent DNA ligase [Anaerolineae bacterium]
MRRFTDLYLALDATTKTSEKVAAMAAYFAAVEPGDAAWAVFFLSGRRPKRLLPSHLLRTLAAERAGIPEWLLVESYAAVGDSAEAASLLLPDGGRSAEQPLRYWIERRVLAVRELSEAEQRAAILSAWDELSEAQRYVFNKLITGAFRVGVSQLLLVRSLSQVSGVDEQTISHRLMGTWEPTPEFYLALVATEHADADVSRPYPFFLAHPLEEEPATLGSVEAWQAEWKWDGIRSQLIKRGGQVFIWSRGEELVTDRYPEVTAAAAALPDGAALDGELLPWREGRVQPFADLQRRIGRKELGKKILADVPVVLLAYDLLEWGGEDWRPRPLTERRAQLERVVAEVDHPALLISEIVEAGSWDALAERRRESRERAVEGFMLKRKDSAYGVGRRRGDWWKWKIEPYSIDAVLIYAQRGSGKRANLYTDYTFAVWDGDELVPFAKAYSGLTDAEIREVDRFVRANTRERFGPVRSVTPELVFELGFEGIQASSRHKSGVAVRFPRILRWRRDKRIEEADSIETIRELIQRRYRPAADADGEGLA